MQALHDSGERFPEPACHPGTRTTVLDQLRSWSLDTSTDSTLLWLNGSAGVGKSAIAQMFAGDCQNRNQLGASFFFKRGHPARGTWNRVFTTISYQLATSVSELRLAIEQAVEHDKLIFGRAAAVQFQRLLVEPFRHAPNLASIPIIVVDGLDECEDHRTQQQILRLFIGAIRAGQFPVRILITSRPEPHLREVLETEEMSGISRHFKLSADKSAYDDIRTYLRDEFSRIHSQYLARGIDLGTVWPPPNTLDHLVERSSGIFIYAATVIRFVDDEYSHPADRLESVLALDPRSTAPLDDLYNCILSVVPEEIHLLGILNAIWRGALGPQPHVRMDPEAIDLLLQLRQGTSRLVLRGLHSLFSVPPLRRRLSFGGRVTFLHKSFADYLSDARRSGRWCIAMPSLLSDHLRGMIQLLSSPPLTSRTRDL
ncbi:hypothetical protein B0H10DRAFT_253550 [Mycena sp. CBHHK59/15]|nr:hypothetical protein B0H10DRAFT_253550 [Mycena sp. CBHHK59/15]